MVEHHLRRQHSSISIQFDPSAPQYFCCFGVCHAKTIGVLILFYELIVLISSAAFLFLKSASYSTTQWQSAQVLILVAVTLVVLILLAVSTALLFMGVCYEEPYLIVPYMVRQILYVIGIVVVCVMDFNWICLAMPMAIFQLVLLFLSLGTYRYFANLQRFHYKPTSTDTSAVFNSSTSHTSYKGRNCSLKNNKLSITGTRPATIDLC